MASSTITITLSRLEAQALARGKHTKGCDWNSPWGGVRCTCNFVSAREEVKKMLRMTA